MFGGAILLLSLNARAASAVVVVNPKMDIDQISSRELKSVFLQEANVVSNGSHIEPVLGKSSMPKVFKSDSEIVAYVAKTQGAIGYVSGQTSAEGVKTVDVVDAANGGERRLTTRVKPVYPKELRTLSIGGTVRLKITILPTGGVTNVRLLGGNPILGESAIRAVQTWKYAPASFRTTTEVEITFNPR
jgi:TonB family protein